ncbi:MAG: DUF697 domain-containing protein [bacterium]
MKIWNRVQKRMPNWFSKNEKNPPDTPPYSDHLQHHASSIDNKLPAKNDDDNSDQVLVASQKTKTAAVESVRASEADLASTTGRGSGSSSASKTPKPKDALVWSNDGLNKLGELYKTAKESVKETTHAYTSPQSPSPAKSANRDNSVNDLTLAVDKNNKDSEKNQRNDNKVNNVKDAKGVKGAKNAPTAQSDSDVVHDPRPKKPVTTQVEVTTKKSANNTPHSSRKPSKPAKIAAKTPTRLSCEQEEFNHFAILEAVETQADKNEVAQFTEKKTPQPHSAKQTSKQTKKQSESTVVNTELFLNSTHLEQEQQSPKILDDLDASTIHNKDTVLSIQDGEVPYSSSADSINHHETNKNNVTKNSADDKPTIETESPHAANALNNQNEHLNQARNSLKAILDDNNIPETIRQQLKQDFQQLQGMLHKLEKEQIHIAVFGRVSVGKSSLLNALIGKKHFSVSLLHGETKNIAMQRWEEYNDGNIYLLDTPGINEIDGEEREQMALNAAHRADLLLFVVDSDLTESEMAALRLVTETQRPSLLVINKADQYTEREQLQLRSIVRERIKGLITPENIVFTKAREQQETVIYVDQYGEERESLRVKPIDVSQLKSRLWDIMEAEGHTLAALNASLFASDMSGEVTQRILATRQAVGRKLINYYCVGKGVAVAANPIPIADLVAAAAIDAGMIAHLSRIYGLPITKHEAGELVQTISAQLIVLLGTTWAINLASSALKITTVGLSTIVTAATQGAIAWYSTLVIGRVAEAWLVNGKSWGDTGPKLVVQTILDDLDRDSVMKEAKQEIMLYLKR